MRRSTLSSLLLISGVTVGVVATVALFAGFEPAPLSPTIVKIALYKLAFIGSGTLLIAGAVIGRWARRNQLIDANESAALLQEQSPDQSLTDPHVQNAEVRESMQRAGLEDPALAELQRMRAKTVERN
ncbi:MAG: hypothetical protein ABI852_21155 [Gemmatimonadaceae bacterium]